MRAYGCGLSNRTRETLTAVCIQAGIERFDGVVEAADRSATESVFLD
jgi:hypothetical protein